jgi:hypothetical protein
MLGLIRQMVAPLLKGPAGLLGLNRFDVRALGGRAGDRRVHRARPYSKRPCTGRAGGQDPPTDPRPVRWPGSSRVAVRLHARRQAPTAACRPSGIRAGRLRRAGPGHDRADRAERTRRPTGLPARTLPVGARARRSSVKADIARAMPRVADHQLLAAGRRIVLAVEHHLDPNHATRAPRTRAVQARGEAGSVESLTGVAPRRGPTRS